MNVKMKYVFHSDIEDPKDSTGHKVIKKRAMISLADFRIIIIILIKSSFTF
jgi:hypothetical protein